MTDRRQANAGREGDGDGTGASAQLPAAQEFAPPLYKELREVARQMMNRERVDHTLQPTAIVHEAYLRLAQRPEIACTSQIHFLRLAAREMRRVLVEHARAKRTRKRGGAGDRNAQRQPLSDLTIMAEQSPIDLLALDEAMTNLAAQDPTKVDIVEMRIFAGMNHQEIAEALGIAVRTVERKWAIARSRLFILLNDDDGATSSQPNRDGA